MDTEALVGVDEMPMSCDEPWMMDPQAESATALAIAARRSERFMRTFGEWGVLESSSFRRIRAASDITHRLLWVRAALDLFLSLLLDRPRFSAPPAHLGYSRLNRPM